MSTPETPDVARGGQARCPGSSTTSTRGTTPKADSGASALASLLDRSNTSGKLIPELARHGLQHLIELAVAAVLGADRHERSEERCGYRNGSRPRLLTTMVLNDIPLIIPILRSGMLLPTILEPGGGLIKPYKR